MSKLVSFMMPTRNRYDWLRKALQSIKDTASDFSDVEILLRIDDDHAERIAQIPELEKDFGVRAFVGPRGSGYNDMGMFLDDLTKIAEGKWAWLFDDDAWVEGMDWQQQIAKHGEGTAENGPGLIAEFYDLGGCKYSNIPTFSPPGMIVPMALCRTLNHSNPVDLQWLSVCQQRNWPQFVLKGISYCHEGRCR